MPDVISDTSLIQYLYQTNSLDLLPRLYSSVIVPEGVLDELDVGRSLGVSLPDARDLDWIKVESAPHRRVLSLSVDLGKGEREVLALAVERPGSLALIDDTLARRYARHLGISFTGTLGVMLRAKKAGHLEAIRPKVKELEALDFWLDSATRAAVLDLAGELDAAK